MKSKWRLIVHLDDFQISSSIIYYLYQRLYPAFTRWITQKVTGGYGLNFHGMLDFTQLRGGEIER